MKTSFIILAFLQCWFIEKGMAQVKELKFGSRFLLGHSVVMGKEFSSERPGLLIGAGGTADYYFTKWFGLTGDALFMHSGFSSKGSESGGVFADPDYYKYTDRYHLYQAEFPIMAKIRLGAENFGIRAYAGPCFGFNILSFQSRIYEDQQREKNYGYRGRSLQEMNIMYNAVVAGVGIEVKSRNHELFFADIRSSQHLGAIGSINDNKIFLYHFCISLGYMF